MGKRRIARLARAVVLVAALVGNLTQGCLNVCGGECDGAIHCEAYSTSACPTDLGCSIEPSCQCDVPEQDLGKVVGFCTSNASCQETADAEPGDASVACGKIPGCVWQRACSGTVFCMDFRDEDSCKSHNCSWGKNCG